MTVVGTVKKTQLKDVFLWKNQRMALFFSPA